MGDLDKFQENKKSLEKNPLYSEHHREDILEELKKTLEEKEGDLVDFPYKGYPEKFVEKVREELNEGNYTFIDYIAYEIIKQNKQGKASEFSPNSTVKRIKVAYVVDGVIYRGEKSIHSWFNTFGGKVGTTPDEFHELVQERIKLITGQVQESESSPEKLETDKVNNQKERKKVESTPSTMHEKLHIDKLLKESKINDSSFYKPINQTLSNFKLGFLKGNEESLSLIKKSSLQRGVFGLRRKEGLITRNQNRVCNEIVDEIFEENAKKLQKLCKKFRTDFLKKLVEYILEEANNRVDS